MLQQIFALVIIAAFLARLWRQKQKKEISGNEFLFWLVFWLLAAVAALFYLIFRLRLRLEKMDKKLTHIIRESAISNREKRDETN